MITLIAGIVGLDGQRPDESRVAAMLDAMNPQRRPEMREIQAQGPAVFGAIRLGPASAELTLPRIVGRSGLLFVADAMVWDRPAGTSRSSEDLLLDALAGKAATGLASLNADFAFARWDGTALELGRDHFGARMLRYTVRRGAFVAFASLPGALLRTRLASRALDSGSLLHEIAMQSPIGGRTHYRDVADVPPAHRVTISSDGRTRSERYWRVPIGPRLPYGTDPSEVEAELRRLIEQAVRRRLPAQGPGAGHVSGGIDSTPLAVAAARALRPEGRRFLAYSFQEPVDWGGLPPVDETPYVAEVVACEPNMDLVAVPSEGVYRWFLDDCDLDSFLSASARHPDRVVAAHASARGAGTILSGWGGDQMASFHPVGYVAELVWHGRWIRAWRELLQIRANRRRNGMRATLAGLLYYLVGMMSLPGAWRRGLARLTGRGLRERSAWPRFLPAHRRGESLPAEPPFPPHARTLHWRRAEAERWYIGYQLAEFAQIGAPVGVRFAFPLLDLDLVRFAMTVPGWYLAHGGEYRALMRNAVRDLLPEPVAGRTRKLFAYPLMALRISEQHAEVDRRLAAVRPGGAAADIVDVDALRRFLAERIEAPEITARQIDEHTARGEQYVPPASDANGAVRMALALDQFDREFGVAEAAERSSPKK